MWIDTPWEDIPVSETVHGLPETHWDVTPAAFDWSVIHNADAKRRAVLEFMDAHDRGDAPHLLLLGTEGTGKTALSVILYRWAVYHTDLRAARFVHVPSFSRDVKRGFDAGQDPFEDVEQARFLVLDDLLGRDPTEYEHKQVIPRLIDTAYVRKATVVLTANDDVDALKAVLRPHEMSRLLEGATRLGFFNESDYRTRPR